MFRTKPDECRINEPSGLTVLVNDIAQMLDRHGGTAVDLTLRTTKHVTNAMTTTLDVIGDTSNGIITAAGEASDGALNAVIAVGSGVGDAICGLGDAVGSILD